METRQEKLIQARASFESQQNLFGYSVEKRGKEQQTEDAGRNVKENIRHISLMVRMFIGVALLIIYIYAMGMEQSKIHEIAQKTAEEIQKNQIIIEKCSRQLGEIW